MPRVASVGYDATEVSHGRLAGHMPAYDFRCVDCSNVCEVIRPGRDDSPVACPVCGGATKQVFHPVGVHFKGSGFYNTDYRHSSSLPAPSAPASAPSCPAGGCESCPSAE
jgi:putative FmdB family regulatory protein